MFPHIPVQVWLLIAIIAAAFAPARYVLRYVTESPHGRDVMQPAQDYSWRTVGKLARTLVILLSLGAFAGYIFTPAAAQFAKSPSFLPIVLSSAAALALFTVFKGAARGQIAPLARGIRTTYKRETQPNRFWASMILNSLIGILCIWGADKTIAEAPRWALQDRCYNRKGAHSLQDELSACNELIGNGKNQPGDLARLIAARGRSYHRAARYQQAMTDYSEALRLDPRDATTHYNLGLIDDDLGDRKGALSEYGAAIRVEPTYGDAYSRRGLVLLDMHKLNEAVTDFSQEHKIHPNDPVPLANRGIAYTWKKDVNRAEQDFTAARALDPSGLVVLHAYVFINTSKGDLPTAAEQLTQMLRISPGDHWSLAERSEVYRRLGKAQADANMPQP